MDKGQVGNKKVFSAFLSVLALSSEIKPRAVSALHSRCWCMYYTKATYESAKALLRPSCRLQSYLPGDQPIKDSPEHSLQTDEYCFNYTVHRGRNTQTSVKGLSGPRKKSGSSSKFSWPV